MARSVQSKLEFNIRKIRSSSSKLIDSFYDIEKPENVNVLFEKNEDSCRRKLSFGKRRAQTTPESDGKDVENGSSLNGFHNSPKRDRQLSSLNGFTNSPTKCDKQLSPNGLVNSPTKWDKKRSSPNAFNNSPTKWDRKRSSPNAFNNSPTKWDRKGSSPNGFNHSPSKPDKRPLGSNGLPSSPSRTPSRLLTKLNISSPSNSQENFNSLSPKKVFQPAEVIYRQARQALHSTAPKQMPGREEELQQLRGFLESHLKEHNSGTLYVAGPPGTGKTACLAKILQEPQFKTGYKSIYINCTSMKSSGSIYKKMCEELNVNVTGSTEKMYLSSIEKFWTTNKRMILLVLDEIDQLDSRRQTVLYTVFEWPSKAQSKLVLVGIANALDLTDRTLPRLQARLDLKPTLMSFSPYSKQQIVSILMERLKELNACEVFSPVALQLLAGKVAAVSGDIRRALDIGRRVLELAESQQAPSSLPLRPIMDHAANTSSPKKSPRKASGPVDLKIVMDVLNSVYGTTNSLGGNSGSEENFPLQQKILVCSLVLMIKKGRSKDVTLGKLHEVYRRVCVKRNFQSVDQAEFLSLCQLVETRGIIRVQMRKETRMAKVCLQWDEEEVASALQDRQLLAMILTDTACLAR